MIRKRYNYGKVLSRHIFFDAQEYKEAILRTDGIVNKIIEDFRYKDFDVSCNC